MDVSLSLSLAAASPVKGTEMRVLPNQKSILLEELEAKGRESLTITRSEHLLYQMLVPGARKVGIPETHNHSWAENTDEATGQAKLANLRITLLTWVLSADINK